jgi:hypothetical protein
MRENGLGHPESGGIHINGCSSTASIGRRKRIFGS